MTFISNGCSSSAESQKRVESSATWLCYLSWTGDNIFVANEYVFMLIKTTSQLMTHPVATLFAQCSKFKATNNYMGRTWDLFRGKVSVSMRFYCRLAKQGEDTKKYLKPNLIGSI